MISQPYKSIADRLLGVSLASVMSGRNNNLNLLRIIAALTVMLSHAFALTSGSEMSEPLKLQTGISLGQYAVVVFFTISGLLIAQSFERRKNLIHFIVSRFLRLWPGLFIVLTITTFIIGPIFTQIPLGAYFLNYETLLYIPRNLSLIFRNDSLPGVFIDNPAGRSINGSLWSLLYEVLCYVLLVICGYSGCLRKKRLAFLVLIAAFISHIFAKNWQPSGGIYYMIDLFMFFGFPFVFGMTAYSFKNNFKLGVFGITLCILTMILLKNTEYFYLSIMISLGYVSLYLAFRINGLFLIYNEFGDYSYGVYIFAFPVQQSIIFLIPGQGPALNLLLSTPIVLALAFASWHIVEKRALRSGTAFATLISNILTQKSSKEYHVR